MDIVPTSESWQKLPKEDDFAAGFVWFCVVLVFMFFGEFWEFLCRWRPGFCVFFGMES